MPRELHPFLPQHCKYKRVCGLCKYKRCGLFYDTYTKAMAVFSITLGLCPIKTEILINHAITTKEEEEKKFVVLKMISATLSSLWS